MVIKTNTTKLKSKRPQASKSERPTNQPTIHPVDGRTDKLTDRPVNQPTNYNKNQATANNTKHRFEDCFISIIIPLNRQTIGQQHKQLQSFENNWRKNHQYVHVHTYIRTQCFGSDFFFLLIKKDLLGNRGGIPNTTTGVVHSIGNAKQALTPKAFSVP